MAGREFWEAFMQGLYQGGVGNPEVNERRRQSELDNEFKQAQLNAAAAEKGLVPANESKVHPATYNIISAVLNPRRYGGSKLNTAFKPDPTQPTYMQEPTGSVKLVPPDVLPLPGSVRLDKERGSALLSNQMKQSELDKYRSDSLALRSEKVDTFQGQREKEREDRINRTVLNYSNALENNSLLKKLREQEFSIDQVDDLINLVNSGNTVASSAMGTKMAKAMGEVGVLTESDIKRYIMSGKLAQGAADKLTKWIKGKPTDATMEEIGQISSVLKNNFSSRIQPIYDRYVNRLSANMNISKEEAARRLDVPIFGSRSQAMEIPSFGSIEEAEGANLPPGTRIMIGGRRATVAP